MLVIAPKIFNERKLPSVGVFWRVENMLVVNCSPLIEAETYGDCITHAAGHYELWEKWRKLGSAKLKSLGYPIKICSTEYESWPRGRVVYDVSSRRFIVYMDKRLQITQIIDHLTVTFCIGQSECIICSDYHYR